MTVPPNVTATVRTCRPRSPATVTEGDGPADKADGVHFVRSEPGAAVYEIGSGRYLFTADVPEAATRPATKP